MKHSILLLPILLITSVMSCGGGSSDGGGSRRVPDNDACSIFPRIINGTPCSNQTPHVVIRIGASGLCTGTKISPSDILTAGHCVTSIPTTNTLSPSSFLVANQNQTEFSGVREVVLHPRYQVDSSSGLVRSDIAVLRLSDGLPSVPPAPLLLSRAVDEGDIISIFGFGQDQNGNFFSLRSGEMQIDDLGDEQIRSEFDGEEGSNTCFGDSGGPAYAENLQGQSGIVGITSTGTTDNCFDGDVSAFANTQEDSAVEFIFQTVPDANAL